MISRRTIVSEDEWRRWRTFNINASENGALFDIHPYITKGDLWAQKRGIDEAQRKVSDLMERGLDLEETAAKKIGKLKPNWKITKANYYVCDARERLGATPDFEIEQIDCAGSKGVMNTKIVGAAKFKRDWSEGVPLWVLLQVNQET